MTKKRVVGFTASKTDREKYPFAYISKNSVRSLYNKHRVCDKFYKPFDVKRLRQNRIKSAHERAGRISLQETNVKQAQIVKSGAGGSTAAASVKEEISRTKGSS